MSNQPNNGDSLHAAGSAPEDDFLRRVVGRKRIGPIYVETMECGHTNSTGRRQAEEYIPCLACEIKMAYRDLLFCFVDAATPPFTVEDVLEGGAD